MSHHAGKRFACRHNGCTASFNCASVLKQHERVHSGLKPYRCNYEGCHFEAAQLSYAISHVRELHFKLPYTKREQRSLGIVDNRDPKQFIETRTELLELEEAQFNSRFTQSRRVQAQGDMASHSANSHNSRSASDSDEPSSASRSRQSTKRSQPKTSSRHLRQQNAESSDSEAEQLPSEANFDHRRHPLVCRIASCGKRFDVLHNLKEHDRTHSNIKPYRCRFESTCTYESSKRGNVFQHVRVKHYNLPNTIRKQKARGIEDSRDANDHIEADEQLLEEEDRLIRAWLKRAQSSGQIRKNRSNVKSKRSNEVALESGLPSTSRGETAYDDEEDDEQQLNKWLTLSESEKRFICRFCSKKTMGRLNAVCHVRKAHFHLERSERTGMSLDDDDAHRFVVEWKPGSVPDVGNDEDRCSISTPDLSGIDSDEYDCEAAGANDADEKRVSEEQVDQETAPGNVELNVAPEQQLDDDEDTEVENATPEEMANQKDESTAGGGAAPSKGEPVKVFHFQLNSTPDDSSSTSSAYTSDTDSNDEKIYRCSFDNCNKTFHSPSKRNIHRRIHQGICPFTCTFDSTCNFKSHDQAKVLRHIRLVHFKLPPSKREQHRLRIDDERNAQEYVHTDLQFLLENGESEPEPENEPRSGKRAHSPSIPLYTCSFNRWGLCDWHFTSWRQYRRHDRFHRCLAPFHCGICIKYRSHKWGKIYRHIRVKHLGLTELIDDDEQLNGDVDEAREKIVVNEQLLDF